MANVKITELTAATALAGTDVLPIVDVGADATKKVSVSDLLRNLPDGTASAPALAFADDQNTGVLSPGNNSLAFATSGTQRLVIDSSGKVGIGTGSPSDNLTVAGSSGAVNLGITANTANAYDSPSLKFLGGNLSTSSILFGDASDADVGKIVYNHDGNSLAFTVSASERLRIDSSGRLLLGTTTEGDSSADNLTVADSGGCGITIRSGTSNTGSIFFSDATSGSGEYDGFLQYNQSDRNLKIGTATSTRLTIDSSGRVGIGTTSPSSPLHVKNAGSTACRFILENSGSASDDSTQIWSQNNDLAFNTNDSERMRIDSSGRLLIAATSSTANSNADDLQIGADTDSSERGITVASSTAGSIRFADDGNDTAGYIFYSHSDNSLRFGSDGSERMRIDSSGNVAIGTSTIGSASLTLYGSGSRTMYQGSSTGTGNGNGFTTGNNGAADAFLWNYENGFMQFATNNTERMRIGNDGRMKTFSSGSGALDMCIAGTAANLVVLSKNASSITSQGTAVLVVRNDGDVENANNSYTALSDVKLKENITDAGSQWNDLKALQIRNYSLKEETGHSTHTQIGVIAQEVETVSPGLVSESPDIDDDGNDLGTVTKSVKYSVLYMKAVKALQEAMNRIETLEAKVAALEAQ